VICGEEKKKKNLSFTTMNRFQYIVFIFIAVVFFTACTKGHEATPQDDAGDHAYTPSDVTPPVIEITTPTLNQVFSNGSAINVTGKLTDDYGLYQGSIKITNDATNAIVKEQLYEIHGLITYNFNLSYIASVTIPTDYTVTVKFEDHGLNFTTQTVKIKVNP